LHKEKKKPSEEKRKKRVPSFYERETLGRGKISSEKKKKRSMIKGEGALS